MVLKTALELCNWLIWHDPHFSSFLKISFFPTLCEGNRSDLRQGQWFSPDTPVSSTNKTDLHGITEILLKVALNTITYKTHIFLDECESHILN
jgi:hypothetical protein